jgi:hypothetical protein
MASQAVAFRFNAFDAHLFRNSPSFIRAWHVLKRTKVMTLFPQIYGNFMALTARVRTFDERRIKAQFLRRGIIRRYDERARYNHNAEHDRIA